MTDRFPLRSSLRCTLRPACAGSLSGISRFASLDPSRLPSRRALWLALRLGLAASAAVLVTLPPEVFAQTAVARHYDLPAGPLAATLNRIGEAAGLVLSFDANLVRGKLAPAVQGQLTAREALSRALAGSGLMAIEEGAEVVVRPQATTAGVP